MIINRHKLLARIQICNLLILLSTAFKLNTLWLHYLISHHFLKFFEVTWGFNAILHLASEIQNYKYGWQDEKII